MKNRNRIMRTAGLLSKCLELSDKYTQEEKPDLAGEYEFAALRYMRELKYLMRKAQSKNIKR